MAIKRFRVNNNSGLAASNGVPLSLSFTINYTDGDKSATQLLTYQLGGGSGGVTFDNGQSSTTQKVNTPLLSNPDVPGSISLKGGVSGTVSITVSTPDGSSDVMTVNYTTAAAMAFLSAKLPVLFSIDKTTSAAGKAAPKKAAPKKVAKKKAAPKKAGSKKKAAKKTILKKAAPNKSTVKKPIKVAPKKKPAKKAAKKAAAKKPKGRKLPVLWRKK